MSISDLLADKIWKSLKRVQSRFKQLGGAKQKHIILGGITLAVGLGLFFNALLSERVNAQKAEPKNDVADEIIDPLNKIGKGVIKGICVGECQSQAEALALKEKEGKFNNLVAKYPMAAMVPFLAKRDGRVAAFLVAIARKESQWGKHTPKKGGRECYNFWGYRGKENTTDSGYSCFDSPEHAVEVVGNRIESLLNKKIDTPAKMVVWKCGRDCEAAGGQAAANKWVSDVAHVYKKLQS
ncbi:MAG: hypothetical protein WC238_01125 [Parcubacteria group bacterium]|jgi:hypothetical protein